MNHQHRWTPPGASPAAFVSLWVVQLDEQSRNKLNQPPSRQGKKQSPKRSRNNKLNKRSELDPWVDRWPGHSKLSSAFVDLRL